MFANIFFYFNTLPEDKKVKFIFMLIISFTILLAICGILEFLKFRFLDENKKSLFQRFLNRI